MLVPAQAIVGRYLATFQEYPVREYAYDRDTSFGRLDKALDVAAMNHWVVIDMKNDWKRIFAFE